MAGQLTVGSLVLNNTTNNNDAFGRLRVSNPFVVLNLNQVLTNSAEKYDQITSGTGAITYSSLASFSALTVSSTTGRAVRQSKYYINYQAGKSKLILMSGVFATNGAPSSQIISRIGHFDDVADKNATLDPSGGNGHFFQLSNSIMNVVERTYVTGTQVDTVVPQSSWNVDKLDGNGPSKKTVTDWSTNNLVILDYEWLGIGRVRCGFYIEGVPYYVHYFIHDSMRTPYTQYASLPVRYEIQNTGTGPATEMRMICQSVMLEGGWTRFGNPYSSGLGITGKTAATTGVTHLLSMSLKNRNVRLRANLQNLSILNQTNNTFVYWQILLNPSFSPALTWTSADANSYVQYSTTTSTVTNGTLVSSGYLSFRDQTQSLVDGTDEITNALTLGATIAGVSDILTLVATAIGGASVVNASFGWLESK